MHIYKKLREVKGLNFLMIKGFSYLDTQISKSYI